MINTDNIPNQKRTLTKVRKSFLGRNTDEQQPETSNSSSLTLKDSRVYILNVCLGLVRFDQKMFLTTHIYNVCYLVSKAVIVDQLTHKALALSMDFRPEFSSLFIEENLQRMETSGSPNLIDCARRLREYATVYPKIMESYLNLLKSDDLEISKNLRIAKARAEVACKDLESRYMYRKLFSFAGKQGFKTASCAYSEGLIKELGFTLESFMEWTTENGLPSLCDSNFPAHVVVAKRYMDNIFQKSGFYQEEPEFLTYLNRKDGSQIKVTGQFVNIIEPTPTGVFNSGYFIVKKLFNKEEEAVESQKTELIEKNSVIPSFDPSTDKEPSQSTSDESNTNTTNSEDA